LARVISLRRAPVSNNSKIVLAATLFASAWSATISRCASSRDKTRLRKTSGSTDSPETGLVDTPQTRQLRAKLKARRTAASTRLIVPLA
jgi:hypothetical protein